MADESKKPEDTVGEVLGFKFPEKPTDPKRWPSWYATISAAVDSQLKRIFDLHQLGERTEQQVAEIERGVVELVWIVAKRVIPEMEALGRRVAILEANAQEPDA